MGIRAYLLVETKPGFGKSVAELLRAMPSVAQVDRVTGPYDVVCVLETDDLDSLGDIVRNNIKALPGVRRTMSCLRFR